MKIGQLTDTHYGRLFSPEPEDDAERLLGAHVDVVVHTGDVSRGSRFASDLERLADALGDVPLLFTLGNHDYHESSFSASWMAAAAVSAGWPNAVWLDSMDAPFSLDGVEIVGSGGWYSWNAWSRLTFDWVRVADMRRGDARAVCDSLREDSASTLREQLSACRGTKIVVATHFPPFCEGRPKAWDDFFWRAYDVDPDSAEAIQSFAENRRDTQITVLSGHTHVAYSGSFDNVRYEVAAPRISVWDV